MLVRCSDVVLEAIQAANWSVAARNWLRAYVSSRRVRIADCGFGDTAIRDPESGALLTSQNYAGMSAEPQIPLGIDML